MDFARFDARGYPVVAVRDGYREWVPRYEDTVLDLMDIRLLERLSVRWGRGDVLDLACGTGRIGAWLTANGAAVVDGIDLTPEMLAVATAKGVYRRLEVGNVLATPFVSGSYDVAVQSLADEHLASVTPLYAEVARVLRPGGTFVLVGFHPHFLMLGVPTHFDRAPGESLTIETHVHLFSDHVQAAIAAGFELVALEENPIDEAWLAHKPKWRQYLGHPVSFAFVWRSRLR